MRAPSALLLALLSLWSAAALAVEELTWDDLIPAGYEEPMPAPQTMHDLSSMGEMIDETGDPAEQLNPAAPVVSELNGRQVRLPGYVVPLDLSEGRVIEFLLVPYFGACIHVPPPPSNQIVHVRTSEGIELDALYQPFWISGPMRVERVESELAAAGYQINASTIEPYVY
ncbi:DUF3299 domain-containing protein [Halopseudomonas nanhaiensis]|uniref:DUF3299 domain-containing protein n=1 Tax=Halopseudomonas nanhaiensis TaxID=2830842 RepID=UPI001CC0FE8C|nr:DUF3299 domain-containing protein [Halopseudomonas nanhaiensis]UAW98108.1 DUF3299 domain-containing protein [Halopseudomonas nanhaiensis]